MRIVQNLQRKVVIKEEMNQSPKRPILHGMKYEVSSSSDLESKESVNITLMASHHSDDEEDKVYLKTTTNLWYLDSGFSKHMTGDINKFSSLALKDNGYVTYGDNNKGKKLGIVKVGSPTFIIIKYVVYVEGLKHNLLSISQL